jgi:hypothetical protein
VSTGKQATVRSTVVQGEEAKLVASDAATYANFGNSVALNGNTAIVGASGWGGYAAETGAAYVFQRNGAQWTQQAELSAQEVGQSFGWAVAVEGSTAVLGNFGGSQLPGAAYVFVRSGTEWQRQATLTPSESFNGDQFGSEISLGQDTVLIGAPIEGHAFVFTRAGASWSQQAVLVEPKGSTNSASNFGGAVALEGDTAIVSDPAYEYGGEYGAVFSFTRSGTTWMQGTPLTFRSCSPGSGRGLKLALSGSTLLIGCVTEADDYVVAVFGLGGSTWNEKTVLAPLSGDQAGEFGIGVGISGGTALVGLPPIAPIAGAVYIFVPHQQLARVPLEAQQQERHRLGTALQAVRGRLNACPTLNLGMLPLDVFFVLSRFCDGCGAGRKLGGFLSL